MMRNIFTTLRVFWILLILIGVILMFFGIMVVIGVSNSGTTDFIYMFTEIAQFFLILGSVQILLGFTIYPLLKVIETKLPKRNNSSNIDNKIINDDMGHRTVNKSLYRLSLIWIVLSILGIGLLVFGIIIKIAIQPDEMYGYSPTCRFSLVLGYVLLVLGLTLTPLCLLMSRKWKY